MSDTDSTIKFHQKVLTPYGPGLIQGQELETGEVIVSHDPYDPAVSDVVKEGFLKGIWILWRYTADQIAPFR